MGVVEDVRAYLQAQGLVDASGDGWPSSPRLVHDGSHQLVIFTEDGGPSPEVKTVSGIGDDAWQFPGLQIRVRAGPHDHDLAYAKAREIMDELHSLRNATLGSTIYVGINAMTSDPVFIGFDDRVRPEYTQSFRLISPVPA